MNYYKDKFLDLWDASSGSILVFPVTDLLFAASLLTFAKCIAKQTLTNLILKSNKIDYVLNLRVIANIRSVHTVTNAGYSTRSFETMLYTINPLLS